MGRTRMGLALAASGRGDGMVSGYDGSLELVGESNWFIKVGCSFVTYCKVLSAGSNSE